jgi:hypothetical protein
MKNRTNRGLLSLSCSSPPRTDLGRDRHDLEVAWPGGLGTKRSSMVGDGSGAHRWLFCKVGNSTLANCCCRCSIFLARGKWDWKWIKGIGLQLERVSVRYDVNFRAILGYRSSLEDRLTNGLPLKRLISCKNGIYSQLGNYFFLGKVELEHLQEI